jgi:hypothetical protein
MNLYAVKAGETDWVAAHNAVQALEVYAKEYDLSAADMTDVSVSVVADPDEITVYLDEVDIETEETLTATAAEVMAKMKSPGIVASTNF